MQVGLGFQLGHLLLQKAADLLHMGIAGDNGVIMDGGNHAVLHQQVLLDAVNDVVALHDVPFGVHLDVKTHQPVARAVIVDHQVMDAQHAGVAQRLFLDMFHQFRVRCGAQDRVDGIPHQLDTAVQNEGPPRPGP